MFENRHWVIIKVSDITDEMFANVMQTSMNRLRKSLDGSKAILKWEGDTPSCFDGMTVYSHSEIRTELRTSEWSRE